MSILRPKTDDAKRQKIEAAYKSSRRHFPEVGEITAEELTGLMSQNEVVLVDVRSEAEQQVSMIPGAIPAQQFLASPDDYDGATLVAYCTVGHRSGLFAKQLKAQGKEVLNLKGAILAWTHAGGELESADGPTRRVHVASRHYNLVAEGYEGVW